MITNDDELAAVRRQIATLEAGIESLGKWARPRGEDRFQRLVEGHVVHQRRLRREVDEYLAVADLTLRELAEVTVTPPVEGDADLAVVREQAVRCEDAIRSLAKTVGPHGSELFRASVQGQVDRLRSLRHRIDEYLGVADVPDEELDDRAFADDRANEPAAV